MQLHPKKLNHEVWGKLREDSLNLLSITPTGFSLNGKSILQMRLPKNQYYSQLPRTNFVLVENRLIKSVMFHDKCIDEYRNNQYNIFESESDLKAVQDTKINICDIILYPFLSFDLKKNEKMTFYGHSILLEDKYYLENIKDTVYKFQRTYDSHDVGTIVLGSLNHGILGIYDTVLTPSAKQHTFYKIGLNSSDGKFIKPDFEMTRPKFDLGQIKEFKKTFAK